MWGAGPGADGSGQQWGFNNANQYTTSVVNEHDKWALLAHQWIQMKNSGGGLEETLQPPVPTFQPQQQRPPPPTPVNSGSNGNAGYTTVSSSSSNNNESLDQIGEAPMELDETITTFQPNSNNVFSASVTTAVPQHQHLTFQSHQTTFLKNPPITQIPPNPMISFSAMSSGSAGLMQERAHQHQQLPPRPTMMMTPMQQQFRPNMQMQQQPRPSPHLMGAPRLLQPSYMDQAAITQSPSSGSAPYSGQSRRRRKQSSSNSESHSRYQEYDTQSQYDDYATGNTDSEVFEGIPRRSLPAWIREGLEKVEQEKRKLEQKEREDEFKVNKEVERKQSAQLLNQDSNSDSDNETGDQEENKSYEMPKPYIPKLQADTSLSSSPKTATPLTSALSKKRPPSPTLDQLFEGMSEEEKLEVTMSFVRRQLTLLLLEVTTDEMTQVAKESIVRAKHKVSSTVQVRKTSALASLISGGPLGLGSYDSDSGSDTEGQGPKGKKNSASSEDEQDQLDSDKEKTSESEAELIAEIERKRLNFDLKISATEREHKHSVSVAKRRPSRSSKSSTPDPTPKNIKNIDHQEKSPTTSIDKPQTTASAKSVFSEPKLANVANNISLKTEIKQLTSEKEQELEHVKKFNDRKSSLTKEAKLENTSEKKSEIHSRRKSKSPTERKNKSHRSRSRSHEKRSDRKRRSKSRSTERKSEKKRRSRSLSKERKSDKKRRSLSRSRNKRSRHSHRSRSSSSSVRRQSSRKHKSDSDSDRNRSRRNGRRSKSRSKSASSGSSSASSYTRRKQRRQRAQERDKNHATSSSSSSKRKSSRRSRSTSKNRSHRRRKSRPKSPTGTSSSS